MTAIDDLQRRHFLVRVGLEPPTLCIAWAIDRLSRNEDEGDLNVALLAGAEPHDEVEPLVENILESHGGAAGGDDQLAAGKYVVELRSRYQDGKETYATLDAKLTRLYVSLKAPSWLTMLTRNCEYSIDVDSFRKPFEAEFAYISNLWAAARSTDEFLRQYDRNKSNKHDVC